MKRVSNINIYRLIIDILLIITLARMKTMKSELKRKFNYDVFSISSSIVEASKIKKEFFNKEFLIDQTYY
jgi:hypothetical protein